MKQKRKIMFIGKRIYLALVIMLACGFISGLDAQVLPPRPIVVTINHSQPLAFGAFSPGASGGTVRVYPNGSRAATGDVVLFSLGYPFTPAMYYVRANPGTVISIINPSPVTLNGSSGGTLLLTISGSLPSSPFITSVPWQMQTTVLIGGILTVGDIVANPPGNYEGTFEVIFVQE
jgi:hypothetical protein